MQVTLRLKMLVLGASASCAALFSFGCATTSQSAALTLDAVADSTIYAESGDLGNGAGPSLFVGCNGKGDPRRGLLAFDIGAHVPKGAKITSVSLSMTMQHTSSGATKLRLYRVEESWGEGHADAGGKGAGTEALFDDSTWTHRFRGSSEWSTAGGTFSDTASAAATSSTPGTVTWTSTGLVADVQGWLDQPETNHGWVIVGVEEGTPSAKRFCSRNNPGVENRPQLLVQYD
jgi:hypothetical protein